VIRRLLPIALAWVLLGPEAASASPIEWESVARRVGSPTVIADAELGVAPLARSISRTARNVIGAATGTSLVPIALSDTGAREHWVVRPTAIFAPDSGATTFLEQLVHPHSGAPELVPTPVEAGHLQPLPAFETRSRLLPAPMPMDRPTIRYHGEVVAMLPLSLGFLGLVVWGRRPKPKPPL
jgi:hypothetical protein